MFKLWSFDKQIVLKRVLHSTVFLWSIQDEIFYIAVYSKERRSSVFQKIEQVFR